MVWLLWLALAEAIEVTSYFPHLHSVFLSNANSISLPPSEVLLDYTFSAQLSNALRLLRRTGDLHVPCLCI